MNLFFKKCKKAVCLSVVIVLVFLGMKDIYCTAQVSKGIEELQISSWYMSITCSKKSILLNFELEASVMPTNADIYRTKIKPNGKYGKLKRIASCNYFINEDNHNPDRWAFVYEDHTVKSGAAYAYYYKAYCKSKKEPYQYREWCLSGVITGIAEKTVGQYTCRVVKNTKKKLVVKLTGKSKKNGLLESYRAFEDYYYYSADLRYKNDNENEIWRDLTLVKYSYDGKKWHKKTDFSIKGKQSVYLHFELRPTGVPRKPISIKVDNYQYVQMFFYPVKYNSYIDAYEYRQPQIRFNLSSGTAAVNNFISYKGYNEAFVWDGDIFTRYYHGYDA